MLPARTRHRAPAQASMRLVGRRESKIGHDIRCRLSSQVAISFGDAVCITDITVTTDRPAVAFSQRSARYCKGGRHSRTDRRRRVSGVRCTSENCAQGARVPLSRARPLGSYNHWAQSTGSTAQTHVLPWSWHLSRGNAASPTSEAVLGADLTSAVSAEEEKRCIMTTQSQKLARHQFKTRAYHLHNALCPLAKQLSVLI